MKPSRTQQILLLAALLLGITVVIFHAFFKPPPRTNEIAGIRSYMEDSIRWQGKYPPDFSVRLRNGETFQLADHIGREVIILNFFATWCGPCKAEMPELQAFYLKHRGDPLVLIGINVDEKPELVDAFCSELKLAFPVGMDTNSVIASQYGVRSYPTTMVIGLDGRVALFQIGEVANADVVFEPLVAANLALLKKGRGGVSRADYLGGVKQQGATLSSTKPHAVKEKEPETKLEGPARAFAERMRCPSCGGTLYGCGCGLCDSVKKKLASMTVTNRTDPEILQALFMEGKRP